MRIYVGRMVQDLMKGEVTSDTQMVFCGKYGEIFQAMTKQSPADEIKRIILERIQTKICEEIYSAKVYRGAMKRLIQSTLGRPNLEALNKYVQKMVLAERTLMKITDWPDIDLSYEDFRSTFSGYAYKGDTDLVEKLHRNLKHIQPVYSIDSDAYMLGLNHANINNSKLFVSEFYELLLDETNNILECQKMTDEYAAAYKVNNVACPVIMSITDLYSE